MDPVILELQILVTSQKPQPSDVIVWLQGDQFDRAATVLKLWKQKMASLIILTGNNVLLGSDTKPGENNCSLQSMSNWLIAHGVSKTAIVIDDNAMNTYDQAVNTLSLAQQSGWKSLLLVGSTHHQLRPFLTFLHEAVEIGWKGKIINQTAHLDADTIPSGRNQTVAEIFLEEVQKINLYKDHVATPDKGLDYFKKNQLFNFRPAQLADQELLYRWRNDPSAYPNFFSAKPVSGEDHVEWLIETLKNKNRYLFIIENVGEPIGQVRFDTNESIAEISITIAPDQRGKGYGTRAIAEASHYFLEQVSNIKKIIARVKANNQVSINAFTGAGYKPTNQSSSESIIILELL